MVRYMAIANFYNSAWEYRNMKYTDITVTRETISRYSMSMKSKLSIYFYFNNYTVYAWDSYVSAFDFITTSN